VRFEAAAQPAPRGRIRLRFAVSDSGIGLTKAEIAKLFRPFAQANREVSLRYGGTGLGLVLVKRLAKAMGGDLTLTSKPGQGSTFTLTVSVDRADAAADERKKTIGLPGTRSDPSLRILCAEDNPFGRVVLGTILTELGHRFDFVGTGAAAVSAVSLGGYDLVLMDVTLPGVDGLEATRRIRALPGAEARVPVIGLSGRSEAEDAAEARAAGMTDYLIKPVSPAALVEALERVA
jgi:CheY-like chemotaxis protein